MAFHLNDIDPKPSSKAKKEPWLQREISFGYAKKFSATKKRTFFKQLSILLKAGVPLKENFQILIEEQSKKYDKQLLQNLQNDIIKGKTFSESLKMHHDFTEYDYYSVQIGEETGKLIDVFNSLSEFYEKQVEQKRNITSALTYPIIIFSTSVLSIFFMLKFVVPMFKDIFLRVGGELPFLTQQIIHLSNTIEKYWIAFPFLIAFVFLHHFYMKHHTRYQVFKDILISKTPFINSLVIKIKLAQASRALELLSTADVPLLNSLQLVNNMIKYEPLNQSFQNVICRLEYGDSLYQAIHKDALFPNRFKSIVKVGEETHQLPYMFHVIHTQYTEEIQHTSKQLSIILEPLIIIFLGVFVALILIAMYLPIFQISVSFN